MNGGSLTGDSEGEIGLFAGGFKGRCHNSGKIGHKAAQCRAPDGGSYDAGSSKANIKSRVHVPFCSFWIFGRWRKELLGITRNWRNSF